MQLKYFPFCLIYLSFFMFSISSLEENQFYRNIQAHLIIKDYQAARESANDGLKIYPNSILLYEGYIKSLACLGSETEMLKIWAQYSERFPDKKNNRDLIEEMCWGILNKASISPSLTTRLLSLLAGFLSQDSRGISILRQGMRDSNAVIRAIAVELAGHLHDTKLIDEMKFLFLNEKSWNVRRQVISGIGKMKIKELSVELKTLIASNQSSVEEKSLAIKSLIELLDEITEEEIIHLTTSTRYGLRLLACQALSHFRLEKDVDHLFKLVNDNHPHVRIAAIQAIGLIRPKGEKSQYVMQIARQKILDIDLKVALSASWLLTLYSPSEGKQAFTLFLNHTKQEVRLLAAAALKATGRYGVDLIASHLGSHFDPYVRLNLALGAITQRMLVERAGEVIYEMLHTKKERWIHIDEGIFQAVAPRVVGKSYAQDSEESTPEMDNQIIRLDVLGNLAIIDSKKAQESIREFLMERSWGISGTASALLLMEGNDSSVELIRNLLQDENSKVRIQAAIILSLWSRERSAVSVLEEHYKNSDKEMKERILESIGRIGCMSSVPLLLEVLKEPSQHLRIIAATALIQCLNH